MARSPMYCRHCDATRVPASRYQRLPWVALVPMACLVVPYVVYHLWRRTAPKWVCPDCRRPGMVRPPPLADGPAHQGDDDWFVIDDSDGVPLPQVIRRGPKRYRVRGRDQATMLAVTEYIVAESRAEARSLAEIVGVSVTAIDVDTGDWDTGDGDSGDGDTGDGLESRPT